MKRKFLSFLTYKSIMWPSDYIELKQIEDLLVCGICYEYMDTSVITPCSHNYCSLCIRKYLHYKTQCPMCFEETFEKDLRVNKIVDGIISYYSQVREKLLKCVRKERGCTLGNIKFNIESSPSTKPRGPKRPLCKEESRIADDREIVSKLSSPSTTKLASPSRMRIASPSTTKIASSNDPLVMTIDKDESSPCSSSNSRMSSFFSPKCKKQQPAVNCPVCKVNVPEININRHLDDCLKRETSGSKQSSKNNEKRKPLSKLVFHLMKDIELRRKLKEFGLQAQGDRKCLETRLQRYITLYNAECDKSNPRSVADLIKQCEEDENLEYKIQKTSTIHKLFVNRNVAQNVLEQERKKYLEVHKTNFEQLIARVKAADSIKKSVIERSTLHRDMIEMDNADVSSKRQLLDDRQYVNSNFGNDVRFTNHGVQKFQYTIPDCISDSDSDSNMPCPLQTYSSEDPIRMQRIEPVNSTDKDDKFDEITSPVLGNRNQIELPSFSRVKFERSGKNKNGNYRRNSMTLKEDSSVMNTPKRGEDSSLDEVSGSDSEGRARVRNQYTRTLHVDSVLVNESMPMKNSNEQSTAIPSDYTSDLSNDGDIDKKYHHDICEEQLTNTPNQETPVEVDERVYSASIISRSKLEKENLLRTSNNVICSPAKKRGHDHFNDGQTRKRRNIKPSNNLCAIEKDVNNKETIDETDNEEDDTSRAGSEISSSVLSSTENTSSRRVTRSRRRLESQSR